MSGVREDVIRRLQACHLASERELESVIREFAPTDAEIARFGRWTQRAVLSEGLASGALREDTSTILDVNQRALIGLSAVYGTVKGWWQPNDNVTPLSSVLKTMPQDRAAHVMALLVWAGLLPAEDEAS